MTTVYNRGQIQIGQRFGRGVVTNLSARIPAKNRRTGRAVIGLVCDCGNAYTSTVSHLMRGLSKSCGCWNRERFAKLSRSEAQREHLTALARTERNRENARRLAVDPATRAAVVAAKTIHGLSGHRLYQTWNSMVSRCENPNCKSYEGYGGRGIRVCPEWHDVRVFISWIEANLGPRPAGYSLDRIDNDGDYRPGNVRWASPSAQALNRRRRAASE